MEQTLLICKLILNNNDEQVDFFLNEIKRKIKDDLYIEIQRHKEVNDNLIEKKLLFFSNKLSIPIIATHEVFYIEKDMYEAHDAYICVGEKTYVNEKKRLKYSSEHYLKSSDEMKLLFKDLPDALANNFNLIKKIKYFPKKCQPLLPNLKDNNINLDSAIKEQAYEGLKYRLENFVFKNITDENKKNSVDKLYNSRLKYELEMIIKMKFAGYFLIVSDYVKWAKKLHTRWTRKRIRCWIISCLVFIYYGFRSYKIWINF